MRLSRLAAATEAKRRANGFVAYEGGVIHAYLPVFQLPQTCNVGGLNADST